VTRESRRSLERALDDVRDDLSDDPDEPLDVIVAFGDDVVSSTLSREELATVDDPEAWADVTADFSNTQT